jgi:hypothetical protein
MAIGFPTKANWAAGDVLTASAQDDLAGTVNLLNPLAKGGLVAGSGANTTAVLSVGTDGSTLVANSAQTTGLAYTNNFAAGKNAIINGNFGVWARGTSFTAIGNNYTADRWVTDQGISAGTRTISQQTFTAGTAPVAGYEGTYFLRYAVSGATITYQNLQQRVEDVRIFAGQTVTVSFWAKADAARSITPSYQQNFGSGGSGSISGTFGSAALTTSWQRFTFSAALPSISGKTIGSNSMLVIFFDLGTTGTASYDFWGVQLEAGSVATAFQTATGTVQGELSACQRYYWRESLSASGYYPFGSGQAVSTTVAQITVNFPVNMRVTPTAIDVSPTASNYCLTTASGGVNAVGTTISSFASGSTNLAQVVVAGSSGLTAGNATQLLANNTSAAFLGFSAEL